MSDEIVAFVRQQLDRQEAAITALRDHRASEGQCINWIGADPRDYDPYDSCALHLRLSSECDYATNLDYGLAEIQAKRRILELHARDHECSTYSELEPGEIESCNWVLDGDCSTVRLLAQPYAGRKDWREDWRIDL